MTYYGIAVLVSHEILRKKVEFEGFFLESYTDGH